MTLALEEKQQQSSDCSPLSFAKVLDELYKLSFCELSSIFNTEGGRLGVLRKDAWEGIQGIQVKSPNET